LSRSTAFERVVREAAFSPTIHPFCAGKPGFADRELP